MVVVSQEPVIPSLEVCLSILQHRRFPVQVAVYMRQIDIEHQLQHMRRLEGDREESVLRRDTSCRTAKR